MRELNKEHSLLVQNIQNQIAIGAVAAFALHCLMTPGSKSEQAESESSEDSKDSVVIQDAPKQDDKESHQPFEIAGVQGVGKTVKDMSASQIQKHSSGFTAFFARTSPLHQKRQITIVSGLRSNIKT
jgi:hypothetical protein